MKTKAQINSQIELPEPVTFHDVLLESDDKGYLRHMAIGVAKDLLPMMDEHGRLDTCLRISWMADLNIDSKCFTSDVGRYLNGLAEFTSTTSAPRLDG